MSGLLDSVTGLMFGDGLAWLDSLGGADLVVDVNTPSANAINWGAATDDFLSWGAGVGNELTWGP